MTRWRLRRWVARARAPRYRRCLGVLSSALGLLAGPALAAATPFSVPPAAPATAPARMVVLVLPGATLPDLDSPELSVLPRFIRSSAAAWVAAWRPLNLGALHASVPPGRLRRDPTQPYGMRADEAAIRHGVLAALGWHRLIWVDPGDLERAEQYAPLCLPAEAREHRRAALEAADRLLGAMLRAAPGAGFCVVAPPVHAGAGLAPFFWYRAGAGPALLYSGSTHISGVITGADLSATLAAAAGAPVRSAGRPVTLPPAGGQPAAALAGTPQSGMAPLDALRRLGAKAAWADRLRAVVNYVVQWLLLLLAIAAAAAVRMGRRLAAPVALAPLLLPSLLLFEAALRDGETEVAGGMLVLMGVGAVCGHALFTRLRPGIAPSTPSKDRESRYLGAVTGLALGACAICALALVGSNCMRWALLGYSIRLGVRFYGVGNEYMGWWVGAAVLAVGLPRGDRPRPWALALLLMVAVLIGHPAFGANLGGGLTGLAAVGVEAWPVLRRRRALLALGLALAVGLVLALAAWDASRPPDLQTHLGRLAARVADRGPTPFFALAAGKVRTNLRLTLGLWGALLAAGVWVLLEARRRAADAVTTRQVWRLLPVAAAAYLFNDSGVVAAALMLSYSVLTAGSPMVQKRLTAVVPRADLAHVDIVKADAAGG